MPILRVCPNCESEWAANFPGATCPDCGGVLGEPAEAGEMPWEPETVGSVAANVGVGAVPIYLAAKAIRGKRCPWCKGRLRKGASVCIHCGRDVEEG